MQPPPRALNAPPEKGGARGGVGAPGGAATPWAARLATAFGMWPPGWDKASAMLVFCPILKYEWVFVYVLLEYAFLIAHFGEFSYLCLQNMYIPNLVKNVSCKPLF